ncbi:MAG: hypothetical protein JNM25_08370 [Planctomycetes bacterium]|nr:hypothetical protein [Planctomycetota bacterium]
MDPRHTQPDDDRLAEVEERLRSLQQHVEQLTRRVQAIEGGAPTTTTRADGATLPTDTSTAASGSWLQHSALLRRIATISFVLVLALVLRTLTDSEVVTSTVGVRLGIGYALLLLAVGWHHLAGDRAGQRVYSICGALLLCALVLETHSRFDYLGSASAHGLLVGTLVACALLGMRYHAPVVAEAGVLTAALSSLVIGFPMPEFHITAATLLLAMLAAAALVGRRRTPWLHWAVLALLLFFWSLWAAKLHAPLVRAETIPPALRLPWFLPALATTFVVLLGIGHRRLRAGSQAFALVLPTWNVLWAFAAAAAVVVPWHAAGRWLGVAALAVAALHLLLAWRFASPAPGNVVATGSMVLAATAAFMPGTWLAIGDLPVATLCWSLAAWGIAWWSGRLGSGGMRALACGLQVAAVGTAITAGAFAAPAAATWRAAALAAALATTAGLHYRWTRSTPPAQTSWYHRLTATDRPGELTLWAAVAAVFGCLRVVLHALLATMPVDLDNAFAGAQSVLLNGIAITTMILAQRHHSRPAMRTAVSVTVLGGIKVFASDLLTLHGIPLVLSVFSFGVTAAVGSLVVGRWQRAAGLSPA